MARNHSYAQLDDSGSLELESLVSSSNSPSRGSVSSRGLSDEPPPVFDENDDGDRSHLRVPGASRARSFSVSTIGEHMFPLAASSDMAAITSGVPLEKQKSLNVFHGLGLVIGLQIGSGIFASPSQVNSHAGSVGGSLIIWIVAGLLAWTGASAFAELGSTIPLNGAAQAYLNHIFGAFPSFLFSWTALTVLKPGSAAIISIIFSEYFTRGLGESSFLASYWVQKLFALVGLGLVTGINIFSTRLGANASGVFLVVKICVLLSITVIGLVALPNLRHQGALAQNSLFEGTAKSFGDYAIALYAGLWAYDGWDNVNYVAAEMKNPARDIPRVIHTAMPVVIIAYVLANLSYYLVLTQEEILGSTTVTLTYMNKIFGKIGGIVFSLLIAITCLGSLNATIFSSARLAYAAAEDGFLPQVFSDISPKRGTPVNALLLQSAMTSLFILVGEFHTLLTFYGVAGFTFYFLTVFGVIVLRFKDPDLDRPYKTYLATPILFCCVALFLISRTVFEKPLESLIAIAFMLAGCPIYLYRFGLHSFDFKELINRSKGWLRL
uniref:ARAD1A06600p n=1 Tax=Blastobotrys adeninivorans TaxID=409370 RepID=A0A060T299_BLAAD